MVSFEIYERDNKTFHLNIENVLLVLLILFGTLFQYKIGLQVTKYIFLTTMITAFILLFVNIFRIKPLYGKLDGSIVFDSEFIQIKEKVYLLENISKIFIRMNDYEGLENTTIKPSFYPRLSNETNNVVRLEFKNGGETITFFKSYLEYDYENLRPFIIALVNYNLMTLDESRKIVRLSTEYEFLKLKNEVNKKGLNN